MISYATLDELRPADDTEDKLKPAEESVYELKPAEVSVYEMNTQVSFNDTILDELSSNIHMDELNKMVQSSELVRPPEMVWSPDFRPSTMIVSYGPTNVQESLGIITFTASTKQTSLGREKDPNKFTLFWMKLKFDQALYQNVSDPFSSRIPRGSQQESPGLA
ncbi:hypothetical protein YC2023_018461 [Brassica napus]